MNMDSSLTEVAVYRRCIEASLERVWENVLDWEHLPWLHADAFSSIGVEESGDSGWRATVDLRSGGSEPQKAQIELCAEQSRGRYVTRTLAGAGAGNEIWTTVRESAAHRTDIEVRFCLRDVPEGREEHFGDFYTTLYAQLWDEDESMMQHRQRMLDLLRSRGASLQTMVDLGTVQEVRANLPREVELGGQAYWIVELDDEIVAYSATCPHSLGPLGEADGDGRVRCPWHGYEFDIRTGRSCDGKALRLRGGAAIRIEAGQVVLQGV